VYLNCGSCEQQLLTIAHREMQHIGVAICTLIRLTNRIISVSCNVLVSSNRQHLSCDCLKYKREQHENCSVLNCVLQAVLTNELTRAVFACF